MKKFFCTMKKFFRWLFGYCEHCHRYFVYPKTRRRNTAFVDDECNFLRSCKRCFDDDYEAYEELWAEYYSGRL